MPSLLASDPTDWLKAKLGLLGNIAAAPDMPPVMGLGPQNFAPSPQPEPDTGILIRVRSAADRIRSGIFNVPSDLQGMIGEGETRAARQQGLLRAGLDMMANAGPVVGGRAPSVLQLLAHGLLAGKDATDKAAISSYQAGATKTATGIAAEDRAQEMDMRQRLAEFRDYVTKNFAPKPGDTPQDEARRRALIVEEAVKRGIVDPKTMSIISQAEGDLRGGPTVNPPPAPDIENFSGGGGSVIKHLNPQTGQWELTRVPYVPAPPDPALLGLRRDIAGASRATAQTQRDISNSERLAADYTKATANVGEVADHFSTFQSSVAGARAKDAASQQAMIFAWMKILDPRSTVREGEYATAENARGVVEGLRNTYNKLLQGTILQTDQVERFVNQASKTADAWKARQSSAVKVYSDRAKRRGLNPDDVVRDYFEGIDLKGGIGGVAGNEGALSDADLWEKKVGEGLSKEQATAYVRARKK